MPQYMHDTYPGIKKCSYDLNSECGSRIDVDLPDFVFWIFVVLEILREHRCCTESITVVECHVQQREHVDMP